MGCVSAQTDQKIGTNCPPGLRTLDALANTPEFIQILQEEVTAFHLVSKDVIQCIPSTYEEASKRTFGNDSIITIYKGDHTMKQRAVLATFLRIQSGWPHELP